MKKFNKIAGVASAVILSASLIGNLTGCANVIEDLKGVYVDSVEIGGIPASGELNLLTGAEATIDAVISPLDATYGTVSWSSSDKSVIKIDSSGKITAVGAGTATITVTARGKTFKLTVKVSDTETAVESITIGGLPASGSIYLSGDDTTTITASINPSDATSGTVTWTSSDPSVVKIDSTGKITGISNGTATITVTSGGVTQTCPVVISDPVAVEDITLSGVEGVSTGEVSFEEGETTTVTAAIVPPNATGGAVIWTSEDPSVATIDSTGTITGVTEGTTTITSTSGGKVKKFNLSVSKVAVTGVTLDTTSATVLVGNTKTLTATVSPDNAADKSVTWTSTDTSIATVDENGVVTGVATGTATITATSGGKSATCTITVTDTAVAVTEVTLDTTSATVTVGETKTLTATVSPDNATDNDVTWTSSDTSVATVDSNGVVTGVATGTVTITATAGGKTATSTITVTAPVAVTDVTLDATSATVTVGGTKTLTATVSPDDAADKSVTWTSSDPSIATVDSNGVVTGVAIGTATITATAGGKTATSTITVTDTVVPVEDITFTGIPEDGILPLEVGETTTITATVTPEDATDKTVTWTSSDTTVATVGETTGTITAVSTGTTEISATSGSTVKKFNVKVSKTPKVSFTVTLTEDSDIDLDMYADDDGVLWMYSTTEFDSYQWYVNGTKVDGTDGTGAELDCSTYCPVINGDVYNVIYTVTLEAKKGNLEYGSTAYVNLAEIYEQQREAL